jgi:hypothetical protein
MPSRRWELEQISSLGEDIGSSSGRELMRGYQSSHYMVSLYPTLQLELEQLGKVVDSIPDAEQMGDRQYGTV